MPRVIFIFPTMELAAKVHGEVAAHCRGPHTDVRKTRLAARTARNALVCRPAAKRVSACSACKLAAGLGFEFSQN